MRRYLLALTLAPRARRSHRPRAPHHASSRRSASASQPCAGVAAFGSFWQTNYGTATLSRVNPAHEQGDEDRPARRTAVRHRRRRRQPLDRRLRHLTVERVNRNTLKVVKRIKVGINVWDVAFAFGSAWATNNFDGSVSRINPATNRIVKTIKTGAPADELRDRRGRDLGRRQQARRARTSTGSTRRRTRRPRCRSGTPARAGSSSRPTPSGSRTATTPSSRIDPATKAVVATVKVGRQPQQGDVAPDGTIWIPNSDRRHDLGHRPADERASSARRSRRARRRSSCVAASATCGSAASRATTSGASGPDADPPQPAGTTRGPHGGPLKSVGTSGNFVGGGRVSTASPTLARRIPVSVSGTRPYELAPPLPVLEISIDRTTSFPRCAHYSDHLRRTTESSARGRAGRSRTRASGRPAGPGVRAEGVRVREDVVRDEERARLDLARARAGTAARSRPSRRR